MVSEEIALNPALEARGIRAYETDLGEFIVQLAGQHPSHITAPALHMTKEEIAELFRKKLGVDARPIPEELTELARQRLRREFLDAGMGISGGNFLIAETGTLVIVTNEGNGRLSTSLPPLHVAVVGIEKVIPDWESAAVLLKLLARSVSGSKITAYNSFITGVRDGGPKEFHLVLLDNGRSRILADDIAREALLCIRCGACMNTCPVYNQVGGYAYGAVYQGPIGAMLTPLHDGDEDRRRAALCLHLVRGLRGALPGDDPHPRDPPAPPPALRRRGSVRGRLGSGNPHGDGQGRPFRSGVARPVPSGRPPGQDLSGPPAPRRLAALFAPPAGSLDVGATVPGVSRRFPPLVEIAEAGTKRGGQIP